jgi:hypothetical protein
MICEGSTCQLASRWNTSIRSIHLPFRNADFTCLELELRAKLIDDFSVQVLTGALAVLDAPSNPIRLNQCAAAMRELFGHTLHALAPDENVTKCEWFEPQPGTKGPTRRQRAKYATQGGLSDDYIAQIGVNVQHLHDVAIKAVDDMSKYTHVRPGTIIDNPREIAVFVDGAMHALLGLFASFAECRSSVLDAVSKEIDDEAVGALITETILDELAPLMPLLISGSSNRDASHMPAAHPYIPAASGRGTGPRSIARSVGPSVKHMPGGHSRRGCHHRRSRTSAFARPGS